MRTNVEIIQKNTIIDMNKRVKKKSKIAQNEKKER